MLVTKNTTVEKSHRKYDIPADSTGRSEKVTPLNELSSIPPFSRVTCEAKVIRIYDAIESKKMQNIEINDGQATARITVWEDEIGKIILNKRYIFYRIMMIRAKKQQDRVYLSTAEENCKIVEIDD